MYFLLVAALVADPKPTPEERALVYLAREVPRWSVENKCHSCHNNGDAARALYQTKRHSYFDTAVVLLALAHPPDQREPIRLGQAFSISPQRPDGAWRETTRPAGDRVYAQRVSTTGWAPQALLATRNGPASR
jgi:hypothetical protein